MEISQEVLEKLRCHYCQAYLSCSPVIISHSGQNICGRCDIPQEAKDPMIKNKAYEHLAQFISFPCKNDRAGCSARLNMQQVIKHEEVCEFGRVACPTATTNILCLWTGPRRALTTHCLQTHKSLLVQYPCTDKPDIQVNSERSILFQVFSYLFLLQVKCDVLADQMWHNVSLLGPSCLSNKFEYTINVRGRGCTITTVRQVRQRDTFQMHKEYCSRHKISNLVKALGRYQNITFQISITLRGLKCCKCNTDINCPAIYLIGDEATICCDNCMATTQETIHYTPTDVTYTDRYILGLLLASTVRCHKCRRLLKCTPTLHTSNQGFLCTYCQEHPGISKTLAPWRISRYLEQWNTHTIKRTANKNKKTYNKQKTSIASIQQTSAAGTGYPYRHTGILRPLRTDVAIRACREKEFGCQYWCDDEWLLSKHEQWLCLFRDNCGMCGMAFTGTRWIDHWEKYHTDSHLTAEVTDDATVTWTIVPGKQQRYTIKADGVLFLVQFDFSLTSVTMCLVCDIHAHGTDYFQINYVIKSSHSERTVSGRLLPDADFVCWDCSNNTVQHPDFLHHEFEITFIITEYD